MKNLVLFTLIAVLIASCAKKEPTNVEINGAIKEANGTKVYLEQIDVNSKTVVDSTTIGKDGNFSFKVNIEQPTFYSVRFANNEIVTVVAVPLDSMHITGTLQDIKNNYWVDNSENSLWIKLLNFQLDRTTTLMDSVRKTYAAIPQGKEHDAEREKYSEAWTNAIQKQINFTREFIIKHATSPASYYALYQKFPDGTFIMDEIEDHHYFKVVASSLNALYPDSQYTAAIMKHLAEIGNAIRNMHIKNIINNSEAGLPNVQLPNVKGDTISLLPMKQKLVVLDFALLTAQESDAHIEDMKNIYNKFKSRGVEIYQVCLDKNKLFWQDAVEKNNIPWICVWDEKALQSRAANIWNVTAIPANYIVNQNNEIVGKNLYGKRLEDRLNDLLKK